jgi:hypothetical protein
MSARAASRLETLGFSYVYRYQAGKADWFAAGLPREGKHANLLRVADVAWRDVPICSIDERLTSLKDRLRAAGWEVCVAVDARRVVLGVVYVESLDADPTALVEQVMRCDPVTFRPHVIAGQVPDYIKKKRMRHALVTTSDGVLVGLLRIEDGVRVTSEPVK